MKALVLLVICFCAISGEIYSPEQKELLKTAIKECQEVSKIERGVIEKLFDKQITDDAKVRDFVYCAYKKLEFMEKDGTVNEETVKRFFKSAVAPIRKAIEVCVPIRGTTGDETAFLIAKCYLENVPADVNIAVDF